MIYFVDDGLVSGPRASIDAFNAAVSAAFNVTLGVLLHGSCPLRSLVTV